MCGSSRTREHAEQLQTCAKVYTLVRIPTVAVSVPGCPYLLMWSPAGTVPPSNDTIPPVAHNKREDEEVR